MGQILRVAFECSEPWFSSSFSRFGNKLIFRRDIAPRVTFCHFRSLFGLVDSLASLIQRPGPETMGAACSLTPYFPSSSRRAFGKHGQETPQRWSIGWSHPRSIIRQENRFRPFIRGDRELTLSRRASSLTLYFGIKDVPES